MSKYDKDTKFYWLQLKEDFFENDAIEWLEEQKPNGRDYAYFYLKLCLKSLKSNGVLIRKVGNILIPYDNKKLAELTRMDFDTVTVAMQLLTHIGLVKILENGEIYINQLENLIGSKSVGAFKKQQQRQLGGQVADNCPPKIEIDIEIEKEIDIDSKKNKPKKTTAFIPPTIEEIQEYIILRKLNVKAQDFFDYFTDGKWIDSEGKPVKNWKQKLLTWGKYRNNVIATQQPKQTNFNNYEKREYKDLNSFYNNKKE